MATAFSLMSHVVEDLIPLERRLKSSTQQETWFCRNTERTASASRAWALPIKWNRCKTKRSKNLLDEGIIDHHTGHGDTRPSLKETQTRASTSCRSSSPCQRVPRRAAKQQRYQSPKREECQPPKGMHRQPPLLLVILRSTTAIFSPLESIIASMSTSSEQACMQQLVVQVRP